MRSISIVLTVAILSFASSTSPRAAAALPVVVHLDSVDIEPDWELLVVSSGSMEPTLPRHSFVLSVPAPSSSAYLHRGAIVAFDVTTSFPVGPYTHVPGQPRFTFLMRVVGLPNDKVDFKDGELMINGATVAEPYASLSGQSALVRKSMTAAVVPADSVYVLGDNRRSSNDSRFSGPVRISFIRGVVRYVSESHSESGIAEKWHPVK